MDNIEKLRMLKKEGDTVEITTDDHNLLITLTTDITEDRECELWFGGCVAEIEVKDTEDVIEVEALGDVRARLTDAAGNELAFVKDKQNLGRFAEEMGSYIANDKELVDAIEAGEFEEGTGPRLYLVDGNWFEAFNNEESLVLENSVGIYEAIEEAIDVIEWLIS